MKYLIPVIIISLVFNIPKFLEAKIEYYSVGLPHPVLEANSTSVNETSELHLSNHTLTSPTLDPEEEEIERVVATQYSQRPKASYSTLQHNLRAHN